MREMAYGCRSVYKIDRDHVVEFRENTISN